MLKSEIKLKNGRPTLYIENEEASAMAYTTYFEERSRCRDFADAGYRIFFVNASFTTLPINSYATGFSPFRVGIFEDMKSPDYSEFEREVKRALAASGDAVIFPRINVSMPKWWAELHPDECTLTPKGGYREALFSEQFRLDAGELLKRFIDHVKASDYAERIGGWQICGGQTQEWFHHDLSGSLSEAAKKPFCRWHKEKYGEYNVEVPTRADFCYNGVSENENENARRYVLFCNEEVARTVEHLASVIKRETDNSQVVGTFYGYSFECCDTVLFGSHALRCLLDSRSIDFFSSPNAYTKNRAFGIDWSDMIPVDSVNHHGKLCFIECDVRTHLTRAIQDVRPGEYPDDIYRTKDGSSVWVGPPTREGSLNAIDKCFAHQLTKGSAIWWFDMWGGWYDDAALMQRLKNLKEIYKKSSHAPLGIDSEVIFFADETAYAKLFSHSPEIRAIQDTREAIGNAGAPYDVYAVEDAEKVLGGYKAAVFAMPIPSDAGMRAIRLCERMGIPYLCATKEHCVLSLDDIREFYNRAGVHQYNNDGDVIYVGNGYVALHSKRAGKKEIKLPKSLHVSTLFGAEVPECVTDVISFNLKENATALFSVSDTKQDYENGDQV